MPWNGCHWIDEEEARHSDGTLGPTYLVQLRQFREVVDHVEFCLSVIHRCTGCTWEVWRRFSEFQQFHEDLAADFDDDRPLPSVPQKSWLPSFVQSADNEFCTHRKAQLQRYVDEILADPALERHAAFQRLLGVRAPEPPGGVRVVRRHGDFRGGGQCYELEIRPDPEAAVMAPLDGYLIYIHHLDTDTRRTITEPLGNAGLRLQKTHLDRLEAGEHRVTVVAWNLAGESAPAHVSVHVEAPHGAGAAAAVAAVPVAAGSGLSSSSSRRAAAACQTPCAATASLTCSPGPYVQRGHSDNMVTTSHRALGSQPPAVGTACGVPCGSAGAFASPQDNFVGPSCSYPAVRSNPMVRATSTLPHPPPRRLSSPHSSLAATSSSELHASTAVDRLLAHRGGVAARPYYLASGTTSMAGSDVRTAPFRPELPAERRLQLGWDSMANRRSPASQPVHAADAGQSFAHAPSSGAADLPPSQIGGLVDEELCAVCLACPRTHAFVPCGHRCVCAQCGDAVTRDSALCPICRGPARHVLQIFT